MRAAFVDATVVTDAPEAGVPTVGCTAMPAEEVARLLAWIDPEHTIYVALPEGAYETLRSQWELPR